MFFTDLDQTLNRLCVWSSLGAQASPGKQVGYGLAQLRNYPLVDSV
jgi:hypothetical protein